MTKVVSLDRWKMLHAQEFEEALMAWCRLVQRGECDLQGRELPLPEVAPQQPAVATDSER